MEGGPDPEPVRPPDDVLGRKAEGKMTSRWDVRVNRVVVAHKEG